VRRFLLASASAAALIMAAPDAATAFSLYTADDIHQKEFAGDSFTAALAREYQKLSLYERDKMVDWPDAELFADKAMMAGNGDVVAPADPSNWSIDDAATHKELMDARAMLINALIKMRADQAEAGAVAQVSYDCWVEQAEEAWQTTHIAACRDKFIGALDELAAAQVDTSTPEETMTLLNQPIVFFDFDSDEITATASQVIDAAVDRIRVTDNPRLDIIGHTDTVGPRAYNERLSMDRAEAVKEALMDHDLGQPAQSINIDMRGLGETDLLVKTDNGVREPSNRRVEIKIWGMAPALVSNLPE